MQESGLRLTAVHLDHAAALVVEGEVDLVNASTLQAAIERLCAGPERLLVDLGGVGFIDASGLRALLRGEQMARSLGCRLVLASVPARIARLLDICGLRFELTDEPAVPDAVRPLVLVTNGSHR